MSDQLPRVCFVCVLMAPAQCDRSQRVFYFGKGKSEGDKSMKELVSEKLFSFFFMIKLCAACCYVTYIHTYIY